MAMELRVVATEEKAALACTGTRASTNTSARIGRTAWRCQSGMLLKIVLRLNLFVLQNAININNYISCGIERVFSSIKAGLPISVEVRMLICFIKARKPS